MFLIPCGNHAQLGGGSIAERLMSALAYGWVERCNAVATITGQASFKISILVYVNIRICNFLMKYAEHV